MAMAGDWSESFANVTVGEFIAHTSRETNNNGEGRKEFESLGLGW